MSTAVAKIRGVPPLVVVAYVLLALLFLLGLWTADRPVMAVSVAGVLAVSLAWWVST